MKRIFLTLILIVCLVSPAHARYQDWWQIASAAADVGIATFTVPLVASGSMKVGPYIVFHQGNINTAGFVPIASYTAADVLAKTLTVDGSGSGLDADLLDGSHLTALALLNSANTFTLAQTVPSLNIKNSNTVLSQGGSSVALKITTPYGYIDMGPQNGTYCHIYSGLPFYFNQNLLINGNTVWNSGNDGSGSGLAADTLEGYHLSTTANSANTVPVRNANGYLNLGWINTTSGDNGTTTPTRIYASNDGYIRYYSLANFKTVLGLTTGGATPYYDTGWQSIGNGGSWSSAAGAVPSDEKNYMVGMYKTSAGATDIFTLTSRSDIAFRYSSADGTVTIVNASGGTLYLRAFCYRIP